MAGLKAAGLEAHASRPTRPQDCDVLLIWNRYDINHHLALQVEAAGGTVLVAENGYLGVGGSAPKFEVSKGPQPGHYYALAKGGHNGQGWWPDGDGSRWARLGIELKPWRESGEHILVLPNRPFGIPGKMMPLNWPHDAVRKIVKLTQRPIVTRMHPGNGKPQRDLSHDLENAWLAVVWSSSAGIHALVAGIPVICDAAQWVCKAAAMPMDATACTAREFPDRLPVFERLAWAQWTLEEIATGEPFRRLLF